MYVVCCRFIGEASEEEPRHELLAAPARLISEAGAEAVFATAPAPTPGSAAPHSLDHLHEAKAEANNKLSLFRPLLAHARSLLGIALHQHKAIWEFQRTRPPHPSGESVAGPIGHDHIAGPPSYWLPYVLHRYQDIMKVQTM